VAVPQWRPRDGVVTSQLTCDLHYKSWVEPVSGGCRDRSRIRPYPTEREFLLEDTSTTQRP